MESSDAPGPLTPAQQALAAEHLRYARLVARGWGAKYPRLRDEAESAAVLALTVAARDYRPGPAKFTTYLRRRVAWDLNRLLRAEARRVAIERKAAAGAA